jgi:hypothetical protein
MAEETNMPDEVPETPVAPRILMAKALFDRIRDAGIVLHQPPFAVNIGCHDGRSQMDPVYPLFVDGFSGLAVDKLNPPALAENLGHLPIVLRPNTSIFPENVVSILREAATPANLEFLKVDIDGYDAAVLNEVLKAGIRPLVIQVEVNSEIPPPIAFAVCPHRKYVPGGRSGFFGCSLSYATDMLRRYDYALVELDFITPWTHDGLYVQRSMLSWDIGLTELDPRQAFLEQRPLLPHLETVTHLQKLAWRKLTDFDQLRDEVWLALSTANEQKHGHRDVPFEIYISWQ